MGEAKRRMATEPGYGKVPKGGRGLVVSAPMSVDGESVYIKSSTLDPQELRMALLFWDKLAWPVSNIIHMGSDPDASFLEQAGVLTRPSYRFSGSGAQSLVVAQAQAFRDLEETEPGRWALSQGENSMLISGGGLKEGRGAFVELIRAVPVPDKAVPLAELLELKSRRYDELLALRCELDEFYSRIQSSSDSRFELARSVDRVDAACRDLLGAARGWRFPLRLADWKASFELNDTVLRGFLGAAVGSQFNLTTVGAMLGASSGIVKVGAEMVTGNIKRKTSPYRYVYGFHTDLFDGA